MKNASEIIRYPKSLTIHLMEVILVLRSNVFVDDFNVGVPIWSLVFIKQSQSAAQLVDSSVSLKSLGVFNPELSVEYKKCRLSD